MTVQVPLQIVAQGLLMKLVTERRDDGRNAHIKRIEAGLTDDQETIMLNVCFTSCSLAELDDDPSNVVAIFIDCNEGEAFDAPAVENVYVGVRWLMNQGYRVL